MDVRKLLALFLLSATSVTVHAQEISSIGQNAGFRVTGGGGDDINAAPWYGLGQSNLTFGSGPITQLAGYFGLNLQTRFGQMVMLDNGNVGIGTASPLSRLHIGAGNGDGITIGNPNDQLGNGGTYAIKFFGFRDIAPNVITAKITAERTNFCCGWLAQGTDLAFYTINTPGTPNADNSLERLRIKDNGNVGIGTTSPGAILEVNGNVKLTAGSGASMTFPDGTVQSTAWNGVLSGGDYAESVNVSGDRETYEPGDVLVIDPSAEGKFLKSTTPYATTVTGIYSTRPGVVGRRQVTARVHMKEEVPMAMTGIVPAKVSAENGPIKPGDLLVTSSKPGYAMKGTDRTQMLGAVVGKAVGHLDSGLGLIEAVVTLQ